MRTRVSMARLSKASVPWLLEALLIVVSVALGFWVTQLQQSRADRELALRVLASLEREVEHNVAAVAPYAPVHRAWADRLGTARPADASQSAFDVFMATRPPLPPGADTPFPFLRRSAWDAAVSGGALRLVDHDVAAALSDVYRRQEIAEANVERLANGVLILPALFDPASRGPSVQLLLLTVRDIESAETLLLDVSRQHLSTIRAAARNER